MRITQKRPYRCEIGAWRLRVRAETPEAAAQKAAEVYEAGRPVVEDVPAVVVDGVEYVPAIYALPTDPHVY